MCIRDRVCLNADCSLTSSLAPDAPDRVRFFGMDAALGEAAAVSDAPRCIFCGAEYEYDYHTCLLYTSRRPPSRRGYL